LNRGSGGFDDNCAGACGRIAPGVGGHIIDGVRCYLRCVDQDVSGKDTVDEGAVREIVTLDVVHDCAKVGVGVANVDIGWIIARRVRFPVVRTQTVAGGSIAQALASG
jgi:hypothetical protein